MSQHTPNSPLLEALNRHAEAVSASSDADGNLRRTMAELIARVAERMGPPYSAAPALLEAARAAVDAYACSELPGDHVVWDALSDLAAAIQEASPPAGAGGK